MLRLGIFCLPPEEHTVCCLTRQDSNPRVAIQLNGESLRAYPSATRRVQQHIAFALAAAEDVTNIWIYGLLIQSELESDLPKYLELA